MLPHLPPRHFVFLLIHSRRFAFLVEERVKHMRELQSPNPCCVCCLGRMLGREGEDVGTAERKRCSERLVPPLRKSWPPISMPTTTEGVPSTESPFVLARTCQHCSVDRACLGPRFPHCSFDRVLRHFDPESGDGCGKKRTTDGHLRDEANQKPQPETEQERQSRITSDRVMGRTSVCNPHHQPTDHG